MTSILDFQVHHFTNELFPSALTQQMKNNLDIIGEINRQPTLTLFPNQSTRTHLKREKEAHYVTKIEKRMIVFST